MPDAWSINTELINVWNLRVSDSARAALFAERERRGLNVTDMTVLALEAFGADLRDCGESELCHDPFPAEDD